MTGKNAQTWSEFAFCLKCTLSIIKGQTHSHACTHMHTEAWTQTHSYTQIHMDECKHTDMHTVQTHTHTHTHVCTHTHTHTHNPPLPWSLSLTLSSTPRCIGEESGGGVSPPSAWSDLSIACRYSSNAWSLLQHIKATSIRRVLAAQSNCHQTSGN